MITDDYCYVIDGLFNHFVNQQDFYAQWNKIEPLNRDGSDQRPGQRGGHQMVIDPATGTSLSKPCPHIDRSSIKEECSLVTIPCTSICINDTCTSL